MNMPTLQPVPIRTKSAFILVRIWRWITSVRKWKVVDNWEYQLPDGGPTIVIPRHFIFDGASIPRVLWGLLSPTGLLLIPGLIHDFAYRYDYLWAKNSENEVYRYRKNSGQWYWDSMFRKVGVDVNGMAIIDMLAWLALALFGWTSWMANRRRDSEEIIPEGYTIVDDGAGNEIDGDIYAGRT